MIYTYMYMEWGRESKAHEDIYALCMVMLYWPYSECIMQDVLYQLLIVASYFSLNS